MLRSGIPAKFPIPWAKNAGGGFIRTIPQASQIGIQAGAASLNDGYPPACFTPVGSGGTPPFGEDTNGILNQISAWAQWQNAGGTVQYDSAFSTAIGGYPAGAVLASSAVPGLFWYNTTDNNTNNPDAGGAGWMPMGPTAGQPVKPQGRLTLSTGVPVLLSDQTGKTQVFYTAFEGNQVPVWNGTGFVNLTFASDLLLTLTAAAAANAIVDVYAINNSGVLALGFGPSWATGGGSVAPGSCARGTSAGSTQLGRQNGLLTNANTITLINGGTTFSNVPVNQATYLGSLSIDGTAGQVSCTLSFGQSRKFGVWNAYNRKPIVMLAGDSTASWSSVPLSWRASNGNTANNISAFTGLAEEAISNQFWQRMVSNNRTPQIGVGWNSTSSPSGLQALWDPTSGFGGFATQPSRYDAPPALGLNTVTSLEFGSGDGNASFIGTSAAMQLTVSYMG